MIREAAADGSHCARAITARFYRALGVPVPDPLMETLFLWLSESAQSGSRIAAQDLEILFPERLPHNELWPKLPDGYWSQNLTALCDVFRKGKEVHILPQDISIGPSGDSMLHWCAFLSPELGTRIAILLTNHGSSPVIATEIECSLGGDMDTHPCHVMPARTTPIDWAIIEDNVEVLKVLLKAEQNTHRNGIESPIFTPATCAAHYQRIECLRYILESGNDGLEHDGNGRTPMFHATRPDIFTRILRFRKPSTPQIWGLQQPERPECRPVFRVEIDVLKLLQKHGASLTACRNHDFNCLHLAVVEKDSRVLRHLLETEDVTQYISRYANKEWSPLSYAVSLGNELAIDLLLTHGANINQTGSTYGHNVLHICALFARPCSARIASKLLDRSPALVNSRSKLGDTALHAAAIAGSIPVINALVMRGAHLMAASNLVTPLGLAIVFWSELGVEEMCSMHKKMRVPYVAAFLELPSHHFRFEALRPLAMILAPGRYSHMFGLKYSGGVGCYDPPLIGSPENILKTLLRYPCSGSVLEYLKIWYHQVLEQNSKSFQNLGWDRKISQSFWPMMFVKGLLLFLVYGFDEIQESIQLAVEMGDPIAVEILLEEWSQRNASENVRVLICSSQNISRSSVQTEQDSHTQILSLLIERQNRQFDQVKHRRTHGIMRAFWRPFYRLYLDLEQTEYRRYNDFVGSRKPEWTSVAFEFRSWLPSPKIPGYPILFVILWAILGQMLYYLSKFAGALGEPIPASIRIWTLVLATIVSKAQRPMKF